jgi:hypothetical protein
MLSFNHLGNLGRLANQMFQYASLKGIASHLGYDFCIPPREYYGKNDGNVRSSDVILYDVFNLEEKNNISLSSNRIFHERYHEFDHELFSKCPNDVDLFGYFQTEKYFKHIENQIRDDFSFSNQLSTDCKSFLNENTQGEIISLHIRRGDYLANPNHPVQTVEYYKKCLDQLPTDLQVVVFSDDSDWCKEQSLFDSDRFLISEDNSTDSDLCLMSLCDYHIIANSSFSWWGAWLAKSKKVLAPSNWFGGDCVNKLTVDIPFGNFYFIGE